MSTPAPPLADPAAEAAESPPRPNAFKQFFSLNNRFLAPILITLILMAVQISFGNLEGLDRTGLAILSSIAMELILGRLITGKWPHLASAYITGISVGILIRSTELWPYLLCSAISITSKYAIRWHGRHLWNPSNLGVSVMLFLAYQKVASLSIHWGNEIWAMLLIWSLGCAIIWRLKRFHICATYVVSFLILAAFRSRVTGHSYWAEAAPITGPMYQLFIFFMITDPKTTVRTKWGQCAVAFLVALVEAVLRLKSVVHAPYYALFIVGPIANAIEIWWDQRRARLAAAPPIPA
jgi:Na+-translocating ferredoxin:NAD+ oxidoreductase RnfD subunit